jgi:hypothetical protein
MRSGRAAGSVVRKDTKIREVVLVQSIDACQTASLSCSILWRSSRRCESHEHVGRGTCGLTFLDISRSTPCVRSGAWDRRLSIGTTLNVDGCNSS